MSASSHQKYVHDITNKYKEYLGSTPRYERYMTGESIPDWVSLLGPDVLLLTHGEATAEITDSFILYNENHGVTLTFEEETQLRLTPYLHDWGEIIIEGEGVGSDSIGVGDLTFDDKNAANEAVEGTIFNKVISEIPDEEVKEAFHIAYQEVAMKRDTKLGLMFNAIERLGYLQTAINAFVGNEEGKRIKNWKGLAGNVVSNQISALLHYAKEYPYVKKFLDDEASAIDAIFAEIEEGDIPTDASGKNCYDVEKVQKAFAAWTERT